MAERLTRGDVITVVLPGAYGKPRPALIVQSDLLNPTHASFLVCPFTTARIDAPGFRLDFGASEENGLEHASQLMTDKLTTIPRQKVGEKIGRISADDLAGVDRLLAAVLGLSPR